MGKFVQYCISHSRENDERISAYLIFKSGADSLLVMNVNLSEGDKVVFEDVGHGENTMLANESILMRGLVVRSHSNQISIRFHSQRSQVGSVMLRYQGVKSVQGQTCMMRLPVSSFGHFLASEERLWRRRGSAEDVFMLVMLCNAGAHFHTKLRLH
ncbi:Seizure 6-like protein [Collichthys lucidus]|uniref:Seizure 6-like protein n=1 Tax=Collichthys lucidus TaxID=240159 RepID=A0A4U5V1G9_COLLU|nr:Seizure 6-like protein [Collichthys lucidus]